MGQVTGVVTYQGKPVEGAAVLFLPRAGGRPASGTTDADGRYHLSTFKPNDGAVVGNFSVTIAKRQIAGATPDKYGLSGAPAGGKVRTEMLLPAHLASPQTSGLSAEVGPGANERNFDLEP